MEPDPWQVDYLRSDQDTILLCSRQSGKSTTTSFSACHKAVYSAGSLTLLLSPSLRQSGELFRKVMAAYNGAGRPIPSKHESALQLELENGSRIVSLPGKEETIRGYSGVDLLIADEASRIPDELYYSVRPMLAVSGGRLVALSTPFGKRGWFHDEWVAEGAAFKRIKVTADQCPRITKDFLEGELARLGPWWYRQEYFCEFVQTSDSLFSYDQVMEAVSDEVKPLFESNLDGNLFCGA